MYDRVWYLSDRSWPNPNLNMINNALVQTGWTDPTLTIDNWHSTTLTQIESISWENLVNDVQPFLQVQQEVDLLTEDNLVKLLYLT